MDEVHAGALGLLLAAGAGRRMGMPKALMTDRDGTTWAGRSVQALLDGGCAGVLVVLGAGAEDAQRLVPDDVRVRWIVAPDWVDGMSASLRPGLETLLSTEASLSLIHLVDLPDVGPPVVARVLQAAEGSGMPPQQFLGRAVYRGAPGHPVVLGRSHWRHVIASSRGDHGAREYLRHHDPTLIECADLATGLDQDSPRQR
ncbi:MAG: NTP transferase domain-containing protein [Nostocoides sp.]